MMAAIRAGELGADVTLIEKNPSAGRKLLLTGKGRCNLTNAVEPEMMIKRFFHGGEFLRDAFRKFSNLDLIRFFETRNFKLGTERQMRVFPASGASAGVLGLLLKEANKNKVKTEFKADVRELLIENNTAKGVALGSKRIFRADSIIIATGGISYAFTGSTGDGLNFAQASGHKITPPRPGLVPLVAKEKFSALLEGLTLKNIKLKFVSMPRQKGNRKQIVSETGELLFTRSGISGPLVLSLSGQIVDWLKENRDVHVEIDLKPALSAEQLDARVLREFSAHSRKNLSNVLKELLPLRMVDVFLSELKINAEKNSSQVTAEERQKIIKLLKCFKLNISGSLPVEEAMVTMGGVSLKDINPRTMESRVIKSLYFAGEVIDVDADTGGFNLQAAFSTGYLAGESAALS